MSEKQHLPSSERILLSQEKLHHYHDTEPMEHEQENNKQDINAIRKNVQEQARPKEIYQQPIETDNKSELTHHYLTKKIKADQYRLTLRHIQNQLPIRQRRFSRFIHKPTIETVSEVASKTIARPSGILGGSIIAITGGLIILFVSHKVGFTVPNSLFAALFAAGFVIGCLLEILGRLFSKTPNS